MESAETFYHELAHDYDAMTNFEQRLTKEKGWLEPFILKHRVQSALDLACGTGIHSIVLSQLGVEVVGTDISPTMLAKARANAGRLGAKGQFLQMGFEDLSRLSRRFDLLLCLGNSLPHVQDEITLRVALENFLKCLNDDGSLVIQSLNFDRVLKQKERIISVKESAGKTHIRFYDFLDNSLRFNILTLTRKADKLLPKLISTDLIPLTHEFLSSALSQAGFSKVSWWIYNGIVMNKIIQQI